MEVKRDILWRVYLSFLGIVALSLCVLGKVIYIQRVQGAYWKSLSDSLHQKFIELDADRGTIYNDDSSVLSTSHPLFQYLYRLQRRRPARKRMANVLRTM